MVDALERGHACTTDVMGELDLFAHQDDPLDEVRRRFGDPARESALTRTMNAARRLLVAAPTLLDPNFRRTVVFIVDHTPDGALGVVLNRPTDQDVGGLFPAWAEPRPHPPYLFVGGPVQPEEALVALGRAAAATRRSSPAPGSRCSGDVGSLDSGVSPLDVGPTIEGFRAFAGYAGWGPGQLDDELDVGGWFVVDAQPDDLLTGDAGRGSGGGCCAARAASWRWRRTIRPTRPSTDNEDGDRASCACAARPPRPVLHGTRGRSQHGFVRLLGARNGTLSVRNRYPTSRAGAERLPAEG